MPDRPVRVEIRKVLFLTRERDFRVGGFDVGCRGPSRSGGIQDVSSVGQVNFQPWRNGPFPIIHLEDYMRFPQGVFPI